MRTESLLCLHYPDILAVKAINQLALLCVSINTLSSVPHKILITFLFVILFQLSQRSNSLNVACQISFHKLAKIRLRCSCSRNIFVVNRIDCHLIPCLTFVTFSALDFVFCCSIACYANHSSRSFIFRACTRT